MPNVVEQLGQGEVAHLDVVAAVLAPALPARSTPASTSPVLSKSVSAGRSPSEARSQRSERPGSRHTRRTG